MLRLPRVLAAGATLLACAGCSAGGSPDPADPSSIAAFPDLPHVDGPITVRLQPALMMPATSPCQPTPAARIVCSADRTRTFKTLGQARVATVAEVSTAPSADHTSWSTTMRFTPSSRAATTGTAHQAGGFGGVVLVVTDGRVVSIVDPSLLSARKAQFLGLEKPEAWAVVDALRP